MKTSREISQIENYLSDGMDPASKLVFEARLLIDPVLRSRVQCQRRVYAIIRQSGRRQLKAELEHVHRQLFSDPSRKKFQHEIYQLFSK